MLNARTGATPAAPRSALRRVYGLAWYVVLPLLPLRLFLRARKEPGYGEHIAERFGRYAARVEGPVLWVHAVSLGETNAARPLVRKLRERYPDATILLTHMTATGRAAGATLRDARVVQAWLPYDVPSFARAFLDHFRPAAGMLLETELWPNLIDAAQRAHVPLFMVNARLSERSARRYARIGAVARHAFASLAGIGAQTTSDATRIAALAGREPIVTGNLKFDVDVPEDARRLGAALRERFGARAVCLLASSREGEEALVLDAWRTTPALRDALLVIVPRHPQRFDEVARLIEARGMPCMRRSEHRAVDASVSVVLGDSMGEMLAYCAAADVVLMGGSLLPFGGQNLIEPIALGRPTIVGPHMFNFAEATSSAIRSGAAIEVVDARQAVDAIAELLRDPPRREAMQASALAFHAAHRGATQRLWEWLAPQLDAALEHAKPR